MGCKCGSISRCHRDLSALSGMIRNANRAKSQAQAAKSKLRTISSHFRGAYQVSDTVTAASAACAANDPAISGLEEYLDALYTAQSEIEERLCDYEAIDEAYHAAHDRF